MVDESGESKTGFSTHFVLYLSVLGLFTSIKLLFTDRKRIGSIFQYGGRSKTLFETRFKTEF